MKYDPEKHNRHSIRLKGYDYSKTGGYFVTVCTRKKGNLLGCIEEGKMILSTAGNITEECWLAIPEHFKNVDIDEFVVMPNHVHGILFITNTGNNTMMVGTDYNLSLQQPRQSKQYSYQSRQQKKHYIQQGKPISLSYIIATFKAAVTRRYHKINKLFIWQSRFYDHIIRNEPELKKIRQYITNNPLKWELDRENKLSKNFNINHDDYFRGVYEN